MKKIIYIIFCLVIALFCFADDVINILPDGKIGIGTDTPTEDIEVEGDVKVTGDVTITGTNNSFSSTRIEKHNLLNSSKTAYIPHATQYIGNYIIMWENGTVNGKVLTFDVEAESLQFIHGIYEDKWKGQGTGKMILYSSGSVWMVESYIDSGTMPDGSSFIKYQDGFMEQWGTKTSSTSPVTINFPVEFGSLPVVTNSIPRTGYLASNGASNINPTLDQFTAYCTSLSNNSPCTLTVTHHWHARGNWY